MSSCVWIFSNHSPYFDPLISEKLAAVERFICHPLKDRLLNDSVTMTLLRFSAAESAVLFFFCVLPVVFSTKKELKALQFSVGAVCLLNSLFVIGQSFFEPYSYLRGGFFNNASINASVIAFTYPFLTFPLRKINLAWAVSILSFIPLAAILLSKSSMALGTIIVVLIFTGFHRWKRYKNINHIAGVILSSSLMATIGFFTQGKMLFYNSGRFEIWKMTFNHWLDAFNNWTGAGSGTATLLIPSLQMSTNNVNGNLWKFLHNDWLQVLIEHGRIGFVLVLIMFAVAFKRSLNSRYLTASLAGVGFCALGNYALHLSIPSLFVTIILVSCFKEEEDDWRIS